MRIRRLLQNSPVSIFLFILLVSCDTKTVYHTFQSIPEEQWGKYDTLHYFITFPDSLKEYELSIDIRHTTSYPYQNLYLFIKENFRNNNICQTDTLLEYILAEENGKWEGNGWGTLLQTTFPYKKCVPYDSAPYMLQIIHGMQDAWLQGITDIGVRIRETE